MSKIIGIDLGTTNSVVAVMEGNQPAVIVNDEGKRVTPSVVAFLDNGERKVGSQARRQAIVNPERTIFSIKRFMGRTYEEAAAEAGRVPYKVVRGDNNTPRVQIGDRQYTPQEISAMILQKLKKAAEDYLGQEVTRAVITVPAYFNDAQRKATKEAGEIAGLKVERIVNEPTAAALAYGLDKMSQNIKVAVFDLGGGTFDISILELDNGVFEVLSTNGDTHLGGDDFDQAIIDWMSEEFKKQEGIDLRKDPKALQRMKEAAENAKIELSNQTSADIDLPYIVLDPTAPKNLHLTLSRAKFEQLIQPFIERMMRPVEKALADAKLQTKDIDRVLVVGGSTRVPKVGDVVKNFFGKELDRSVNPDEVVALGAAVQGGVLAGEVKGVVLLDVTPLSLGIETLGGKMNRMIEANTTIPTKKVETYSTAADNQPSVEIHILQGERPMASDNRSLGKFILDGIPPAPRGLPQIEVAFDIDANGILSVTARDKATGKSKDIRIEASSGLTDAEISRMKADAEANAASDRERAERIDKLNAADTLIFQTEQQLKELGDKLTEVNKRRIEDALKRLREAHSTQHLGELESASEELNQAWQAASAEMYQGAAAGGGAGPQPEGNGQTASASGEPDVSDVEYEEVNDDDKRK